MSSQLKFHITYARTQTELEFSERESRLARQEFRQLLQEVASRERSIVNPNVELSFSRREVGVLQLSQYFDVTNLNAALKVEDDDGSDGQQPPLQGALLDRIVSVIKRRKLFGANVVSFDNCLFEIYDPMFDDFFVIINRRLPVPTGATIRIKRNNIRNVFHYFKKQQPIEAAEQNPEQPAAPADEENREEEHEEKQEKSPISINVSIVKSDDDDEDKAPVENVPQLIEAQIKNEDSDFPALPPPAISNRGGKKRRKRGKNNNKKAKMLAAKAASLTGRKQPPKSASKPKATPTTAAVIQPYPMLSPTQIRNFKDIIKALQDESLLRELARDSRRLERISSKKPDPGEWLHRKLHRTIWVKMVSRIVAIVRMDRAVQNVAYFVAKYQQLYHLCVCVRYLGVMRRAPSFPDAAACYPQLFHWIHAKIVPILQRIDEMRLPLAGICGICGMGAGAIVDVRNQFIDKQHSKTKQEEEEEEKEKEQAESEAEEEISDGGPTFLSQESN